MARQSVAFCDVCKAEVGPVTPEYRPFETAELPGLAYQADAAGGPSQRIRLQFDLCDRHEDHFFQALLSEAPAELVKRVLGDELWKRAVRIAR